MTILAWLSGKGGKGTLRWGRWLFWGCIGLIVLATAYMTFRPQPLWVEVATVAQAPLKVTVSEEGKTRVKDRYVISAPVAGYLRRIDLNVGDRVHAGERLTELEPLRSQVLDARARAESRARIAAAEAALKAAEEQVNAARASSEQASANYARLEKLSHTNFVSQDSLQQARADDQRASAGLRSARFNVEVARHEVDAARTQLAYSAADTGNSDLGQLVPIRSPVSGLVLKVVRESEGVIGAGGPLLEVGDPAALEVIADVLSFDAVKLHAGIPVELEGWGGHTLKGVVSLVEPQGFTKVSALGVDEQRVRVVVAITSPREQWRNLGDGYRMDTVFVLWSADRVLQVPLSATFTTPKGTAVFLIVDGRARERLVTIGHDDGFSAQVLSGLRTGDRVVRHPDGQIRDGVRLQWQ